MAEPPFQEEEVEKLRAVVRRASADTGAPRVDRHRGLDESVGRRSGASGTHSDRTVWGSAEETTGVVAVDGPGHRGGAASMMLCRSTGRPLPGGHSPAPSGPATDTPAHRETQAQPIDVVLLGR